VLSHYRYDKDLNGNWTRTPLHDDASNGADAFRYFAVSIKYETDTKPKPALAAMGANFGQSWMNM
jgi:phage terminase large subunit